MIRKRENIVARVIHDSYFLIDIIIGLLESSEIKNPELIINKIRPSMVRRGEMMDVDDIVDLLSNEITEDINRNFIKKDVVEFLNALQSEKFLEVIDGGK